MPRCRSGGGRSKAPNRKFRERARRRRLRRTAENTRAEAGRRRNLSGRTSATSRIRKRKRRRRSSLERRSERSGDTLVAMSPQGEQAVSMMPVFRTLRVHGDKSVAAPVRSRRGAVPERTRQGTRIRNRETRGSAKQPIKPRAERSSSQAKDSEIGAVSLAID